MTSVLGIIGADWKILAADRMVCGNGGESEVPISANKIMTYGNIHMTVAGDLGAAQQIYNGVKKYFKEEGIPEDEVTPIMFSQILSEGMFELRRDKETSPSFDVIMIGYEEENVIRIIRGGAQIESKTFFSSGSGQDFIQAVLSMGYHPDMSLKKALNLVKKAIVLATKLDLTTGRGCDIIAIGPKGVKKYRA